MDVVIVLLFVWLYKLSDCLRSIYIDCGAFMYSCACMRSIDIENTFIILY